MVRKLKNLKISKRLTVSYAVILALLVIGIIVSVVNLVSIGDQIEKFYEHPFKVSESANIINAKFEQMQKSVYRAISNMDQQITNEAIQEANDAGAAIQAELPVIQELFLGDKTIVEGLQNKLSELKPMREAVLEMAALNKNTEAAQYMEDNNIPKIAEATTYLTQLIETASNTGATLISNLQNTQTVAIIILAILGVASVVISLAFAQFITNSITKPVEEIRRTAENLSKGVLDTESITYESRDELGQMADYMKQAMTILAATIRDLSYVMQEIAAGDFTVKSKNESVYVGEFQPLLRATGDMITNLSQTLTQINEASEQVQVGSAQMAESAQGLAEGATEQAGAVEELNATVEDVAGMAQNSAEVTKEAFVQVNHSVKQAESSQKEMRKLIDAMEEIDTTSKEIGNIIATIEDIASQTNMLSLNASIEAARAGDAGRGFAVVADQIGKLAADSAQSASNTRDLIMTILEKIRVGSDITNSTAHSFEEIIKEIEKFADIARDTSQKAEEQYGSLRQITAGIEQISGVVQNNSAAAEETSATSEELAAQADSLKTLVARFKLENN